MSFEAFMNDPKGYCAIHEIQLFGAGDNLVPAAVTRAAPVANAAHGTSIQFTHVGNVTMVQAQASGAKTSWADPNMRGMWEIALAKVGKGNKRSVIYRPAVGGALPDLRILPWSGTDVTFMQLNGAANFAVTGPLSGCTVSVVRHLGVVWFFHANFAGGGGLANVNHGPKQAMIRNAGAIVNIPPGANYFFCEYGPGHTYDGQGFVWGRQRGGGLWKFYAHSFQPTAIRTTEDRKWAEL